MGDPGDQAGGLRCTCGNGKIYANRKSLRQHQERYHRAQPNALAPEGRDDLRRRPASTAGYDCPHCDRSFTSSRGLGLHKSKAHEVQYNSEQLVAATEKTTYGYWSQNELGTMARFEAAYDGINVNQFLTTKFPHRTLESIKGQRRKPTYKALVERLKADIEEAGEDDSTSTSEEDPFPPPASPMSPPRLRPRPRVVMLSNITIPSSRSSSEEEDTSNEPSVLGDPDFNPPSPPRSPGPEPTPLSPPRPDQFLVDLSDFVSEHLPEDHLASNLLGKLSDRSVAAPDIEDYLRSLVEGTGRVRRRRPNSQPRHMTERRRNPTNASRAYRYKVVQGLYKTNTALLASCIVNNIVPGDATMAPPIGSVEEEYSEIFGSESKNDSEIITDYKEHDVECDSFIKIEEVRRVVKQRGSEASGPDGIRLGDVRALPVAKLTFLFNVMFFTSLIPAPLKDCRTSLIPKGGDPLLVGSWRPITVTSILLRLLHKILAGRLSRLPLDIKQRGFRGIDGTLANSIILHTVVKSMRRLSKPHVIVSLDLRKAFDTVSHNSIMRSLLRFGVGARMSSYIKASYSGCKTTVACGGQTTAPINICQGVRQGDPMSPMLFNMVLDELLAHLDTLNIGLPLGDQFISGLAYADDLVLLAGTPYDAQKLIHTCQRFFERRGMAVNASKCSSVTALSVPHKKKLAIQNINRYSVGGRLIPAIGVDASYKYLGFQFNYRGVVSSETGARELLERIGAAPLKPQQKLHLAKTYVLPKFIYGLQDPGVSLKRLEQVDADVRFFVKRALHLPVTTPNACLYAACRSGGLGLFGFRDRVPNILRERLLALRASDDHHIRAALWEDHSMRLISKLERWGMRRGLTATGVKNYWTDALEVSSSGGGITQGKSTSHSGFWVDQPPKFWSGRDYVGAIQLRTNTLPCIGGLQNARQPLAAKKCRAGCGRVESESHILQKCPSVHNARLQRHNFLTSILAKMASKKGWKVEEEPRIRDTTGLLRKPDLVLTRASSTIICEATVSWEGPDGLTAARNNKLATYGYPEFVEAVKKRYPGNTLTMLPLVIGARGIWPPDNLPLANTLGLTRTDICVLITGVVKGGVRIHSQFMRGL